MIRFLTIVATGSALALASVAAPTAADARCYRCGVGSGVVGGIAAGAIISGAVNGPYANGPYAYAPGDAYGSAYGSAAPAYGGYGGGYGYAGSVCDYRNFGPDYQLHGTC